RFRIASKGMPVLRSRQTGDMYVQVVVETPQNLTKKQQELLAEFEKLSSGATLKKPLGPDDEVRFLRSWMEKPLHMGAVMPSGKVLARTMAQYVDVHSDSPVVELGPGTGAITSALIEHGIDQKRLVLVEYNPGFCALLRDRYPQAKVVQGDAYALRDSLWDVLSAPAA